MIMKSCQYDGRRGEANMKLHSVQFKFLITVISAMLAIALFVGGFSIYEVDNYIRQQTKNLIESSCSSEAAQINDIFGDMEKSVRIMESYVLSLFGAVADVENADSQAEVIGAAEEMFAEVAKNTTGAIAYYLRLDPAISNYTSGLFYSKIEGGDEYIQFKPTDISLYDKNDTEHVGWFWQPYEAGHPMWMAPYYNQNNNVFMISYVVPLYCSGRFVGVVGMDFDYTVLTARVHEIKIYENGSAHLELNGETIHADSSITDSSLSNNTRYLSASRQLANGMTLVLSAGYDDINKISYTIAFRILLSMLFLMLIFSLIVFFMVRQLVMPLKKLTEASIKLSRGDYDVDIEHSDTEEIKLLSTAFENMIMNLREHKKLQHMLAYRDPMTGLRNTTSYKEWVLDFERNISDECASFGVAILDINNLKEANDAHGHILGNDLIITVSRIISDTFKRSPVFRVGGDEFVVILQGRDLDEMDTLFSQLDDEFKKSYIKSGSTTIPVSVARGFAEFVPGRDGKFADVFNRADVRMYRNKSDMKRAKN